ncbi:hypothetical protein L596_010786 [Steinernema carpocapsae]|uniref:Uncharacterized protein n=1 Tax=Steinernema carpocapsae TaxID=34508 RepID=A0A4U5PLH9_STECR|nr:hypothetical protein L596_010786 [Steinernema carpocapsae]
MEDEMQEMKAQIGVLEAMIKKFRGTIDVVMRRDAQLERMLKVSQNRLADMELVQKENAMLKARIAQLEEMTGQNENRAQFE